MARFGLSPYSNPIDAGINTYAKLSGIFRDQDQLAMEKEDHKQRIQMNQLAIDERQAELPARQAESKARKMKAEHEVIHPFISSAMMKNMEAKKNGAMPEYSAEEIDAIMHLNKEAPLLDNDPKEAMRQISALHNLQSTMQQVTPNLMQYAQKLPEGQRKVRLNDQNAPGIVNSFNVAFSKMLNGKQAESFLLDMDQGTVIPIIHSDDKKTPVKPLTETGDNGQEYVKSIPIKLMQDYITKGQSFGNLLLPALAQTEDNHDLMKQVQAAGMAREQSQSRAKTLDDYSTWLEKHPDATVAEKRVQIQKLGGKHNLDEKTIKDLSKDATEKDPMELELQKEQWYAEKQDKDIKAREKAEDKRLGTMIAVEGMRERHADAREARREARAKKKDDEQSRRDRYIKEAKADLRKDPAYQNASAEDIQDRAEDLADARIKGMKAPSPSKGDTTRRDLTNWMKSIGKESWIQRSGLNDAIKDAVEKSGHSVSDLKSAADKLPHTTADDREHQQKIQKAIAAYEKKPAGKSSSKSTKSGKQFDSLPSASKYNGKIIKDNETGIRYKSNGSRWEAIPEA